MENKSQGAWRARLLLQKAVHVVDHIRHRAGGARGGSYRGGYMENKSQGGWGARLLLQPAVRVVDHRVVPHTLQRHPRVVDHVRQRVAAVAPPRTPRSLQARRGEPCLRRRRPAWEGGTGGCLRGGGRLGEAEEVDCLEGGGGAADLVRARPHGEVEQLGGALYEQPLYDQRLQGEVSMTTERARETVQNAPR
eukprot:1193629-Prorocentrum_minimum.AAC.1